MTETTYQVRSILGMMVNVSATEFQRFYDCMKSLYPDCMVCNVDVVLCGRNLKSKDFYVNGELYASIITDPDTQST